jgi:hypothetical protein
MNLDWPVLSFSTGCFVSGYDFIACRKEQKQYENEEKHPSRPKGHADLIAFAAPFDRLRAG